MNHLHAFVLLALVCCMTLNVQALHDRSGHNVDAHRRLIQRRSPSPDAFSNVAKVKRAGNGSKRCRAKPKTSDVAEATTSSAKPTTTSKSASTPKSTPPSDDNDQSNGGNNGGGNSEGLINVKSSCGAIGATKKTTATSGPNGNLDWLNCGINDGGWRPPFIRTSDIVTADLSSAIKESGSPFKACSEFIGLFEKYGGQFGIPSIMLASFALQESSCNPNTVGGGGEQGLMQITKDKCGGSPGGNCKDPDFNIRTGAKFFSDTLNDNGGDLLLTIGQYNGWSEGLTFGKATAAAQSSCCRCQNNLDYLHQFLNGWLQNIDAYSHQPPLGKYFNLDHCN